MHDRISHELLFTTSAARFDDVIFSLLVGDSLPFAPSRSSYDLAADGSGLAVHEKIAVLLHFAGKNSLGEFRWIGTEILELRSAGTGHVATGFLFQRWSPCCGAEHGT